MTGQSELSAAEAPLRIYYPRGVGRSFDIFAAGGQHVGRAAQDGAHAGGHAGCFRRNRIILSGGRQN